MANLYQDANCRGAWLFDDDLTDESGEGNTLTANGTPGYSTDRPTGFTSGKSIELDRGTPDYLTRAYADLSANFPGKADKQDWAYAFWGYWDSISSAAQAPFSKYYGSFYFGPSSTGVITLWQRDSGGTVGSTTLDTLSGATWYHIVCSMNGDGTDTVYTVWISTEAAFGNVRNGTGGTFSGCGDVRNHDVAFCLGQRNTDLPMGGHIYQPIIFDRTLSAAEAEELYTYGFDYAGVGGSAVPLIMQKRRQAARRRRSGLFAIQMPGWIRRKSGLLVKA